MDEIRLDLLDVEYARFNSLKTVGDPRDSAFSVVQVGLLTVIRDEARDGSYYNRVLGLTQSSAWALDDALGELPPTASHRVDIDLRRDQYVANLLSLRGFRCVHHLVWLYAKPRVERPSIAVRRLAPEDRDVVRDVLELEGPIAPDIWESRREYLCTDSFRFFAVEQNGSVVSLATTFVGEHGAVLGNAFTREEARGRGYQRALLVARLEDAAKLGLDWVVTDVEFGTTSQRNCERAGFSVYCEQELWELDRAGY